HGKGQGEVAGAEDRYRPKRTKHRPDVRLRQWLTVGLRVFDPRIDPRTLFDKSGKQPELTRRSHGFPSQPGVRQSSLQHSAYRNILGDCLDLIRDGPKKGPAFLSGKVGIRRKRSVG